jgi:hypothetical protein
VDDARKLSPEHLKFIDDFICETHAAGGTVSVPTCADELAKSFPRKTHRRLSMPRDRRNSTRLPTAASAATVRWMRTIRI